jgi:hypothetical protein
MATPIVTTCPECAKEIKVPANLEGKKIRCKDCENVFVVKAAAADKPAKPAAKPAAKAPAKPAAKKGPAPKGAKAPAREAPPKPAEDEENANPYGMTEEDLTPRCPHCAHELEEGDIICLSCGYNTHTRARHGTTVSVEHNAFDWTLWLAPPIICIILALGLIGGEVFLWTSMAAIVEENKEAWWAFAPRAMSLWGTILSLAIQFFCVRFAIKRLCFHPRPPEKVKKATGGESGRG